MNSRPDFAEISSAPQALQLTKTWFIVSQVKSHRVVYFTDDPDYTPPTEGDWYYVSPYQGELPQAMSLRNCWGWRFNGMEFSDAREGKKPDAAQTLLASNKEALHKLLRDKIDLLRKPLVPGSVMGHTLRTLRLEEATAILSGKPHEARNWKLLPTSAAARGISLQAMARRTVDAHDNETRLLLESEVLRDAMAVAIDAATDQQQLMALRQRLMNEIAPQAAGQLKVKPEHTTPRQLDAQPTPDELHQEKLRLNVQLRLKINAMRRGYVSEYLLDDMVLKHKGRVAQEVLAQGGQVPKNIDATVLASHAAGRGQTLAEAAAEVLTEMDETARVLLDTEQLKDAMLSRIAAVSTFPGIETLGKAIHGLSLQALAVPAPAGSLQASARSPDSPMDARSEKTMARIRQAVIEASRDSPEAPHIPRVEAGDATAFLVLAKAGKPFILHGIVNQWPLAALTPQTLQAQFAQLRVRARVANYVEAAFTPQRQQQEMSLAEYLELIEQHGAGLPPYLGNQVLPELTALCQWPAYFQKWDKPRIWLGPAGTVTPLHCDYDDNLFAQVWGQKRFLLYPPHHAEFLYLQQANPALSGSPFDPDAPDYAAFPLARQARQMECVVQAGEMLFLPAGWFHHVRAETFSLSANRWTRERPLALSHHNKH
jgi:hypothetical protein